MLKKFNIPSIDDMKKSDDKVVETGSLFKNRPKEDDSSNMKAPIESSNKQNEPNQPVSCNVRARPSKDLSIDKQPSSKDQCNESENQESVHLVEDVPGTPTKNPSVQAGVPLTPPRPGKTASLFVSTKQKGNPILKFIRSVPWEFSDIVPDYQLGQTSCALFLSLRYHSFNPEYVHQRLKQLGHMYELRVLLVQVDMKDPHHALKELAKICILADCTLILAFSPEEAGRYLETYKAFESKPPDLIKEKTDSDFLSKFTDSVTSVKKVNKTDAMTLLSTFGTFADLVGATEEDLSLCPGFGPQKARRLHHVFNEPFLKAKTQKGHKEDDGASSTRQSLSPSKRVSTSVSPTASTSAASTSSATPHKISKKT